jgi:predicted aspartyl protease
VRLAFTKTSSGPGFCHWRDALRLQLLWLALLLASSATGVAERLNLPARLEELGFESVPLRRTGQNHWYLFGQVDGRKRSCLVDTGWSYTTVATNATGRLAETNRIRTLKLGGVGLTNVPAQGSDLRVNGEATAYAVVLGCDFLVQQQAILDCGNNKLYLRTRPEPTNSFATLEAQLSRAGWVSIPLNERQPPALTCAARINERTTELLVDSGAMWSCLDQTFASNAGLRTSASLHRMSGPGADRQRNYRVADLTAWSLGTMPMPERTVAVLALEDWGLGAGGKLFPEVGGILGGAELKTGAALIDCGNRKLWLRLTR